MIPTGKTNRITGEPIMQTERSDVPWSKTWEELTDIEKTHFLSYMKFGFLNKEIEPIIRQHYINQREAARADLLF